MLLWILTLFAAIVSVANLFLTARIGLLLVRHIDRERQATPPPKKDGGLIDVPTPVSTYDPRFLP